MAGVTGAQEIFMRRGDALLFVDSCAHGSAPRTTEGPGARRFVLYRYGPSWGSSRYGCECRSSVSVSCGANQAVTSACTSLLTPGVLPRNSHCAETAADQPSAELLARLTPRRRKILLPGGVEPLLPPSCKL